MSAPHIDENLLDQYAIGQLGGDTIEAVEEHLLECRHCQERLIALDEFIGLFRAAATQPDARPVPFWQRFPKVRVLAWSAAAVMATVVSFISLEFRKPAMTPATVLMQAFRGPETTTVVAAGKPVRLIFDLQPAGSSQDYQFEVVNLLGTRLLASPVEFDQGRPSVLINQLEPGSYWARISRKADSELIAEYGLRAE